MHAFFHKSTNKFNARVKAVQKRGVLVVLCIVANKCFYFSLSLSMWVFRSFNGWLTWSLGMTLPRFYFSFLLPNSKQNVRFFSSLRFHSLSSFTVRIMFKYKANFMRFSYSFWKIIISARHFCLFVLIVLYFVAWNFSFVFQLLFVMGFLSNSPAITSFQLELTNSLSGGRFSQSLFFFVFLFEIRIFRVYLFVRLL